MCEKCCCRTMHTWNDPSEPNPTLQGALEQGYGALDVIHLHQARGFDQLLIKGEVKKLTWALETAVTLYQVPWSFFKTSTRFEELSFEITKPSTNKIKWHYRRGLCFCIWLNCHLILLVDGLVRFPHCCIQTFLNLEYVRTSDSIVTAVSRAHVHFFTSPLM